MYKTVLVPLDGSKLAEVVFSYASDLVARMNLDSVLLHVSDPGEAELMPMKWAYVERAAETIAHQAAGFQSSTGGGPPGSMAKARGDVISGDAAEGIISYADGHDIDLILMSTHGRSGVGRWVLGSVADKVLRSARAPVWLVRAPIHQGTPPGRQGRTILVLLDGSKLSETALPHAEALAKQWSDGTAEVVLLTVCGQPELLSMPEYYLTPESVPPARPLKWEDYARQQQGKCEEASEHYLADVSARLKRAGVTASCEVLSGKPAESIADYVAYHSFDLIVMSTHGRSGIRRWAFGSVAEKVLRGVATPILMIRPS